MKIRAIFSNSIAQIYIICIYLPLYVWIGRLCLKYKRKPTVLREVNPAFPYWWLICTKSIILEKFLQKKENTKFFTASLHIPANDFLSEKIKKSEIFLQKNKLHYPLILKPDNGVGGIGVQFIKNKSELKSILSQIKKDHILQEYVSRSEELSIFFIKEPHQKKGEIWSITKRYSIKQTQDPELMIPERRVICNDESHRITPIVHMLFNDISDIPWFHFGRFDIRVKDMEKFLSTGKDFTIIEVNVGAHSMALHAFDTKYNWIKKYRILFNQILFAFKIADKNADIPSHYPHQNFKEFLEWFMNIYKNG